MAARIGTVASLWRYPVKSMRGEELPATKLTEHGLLGDQVYALINGADGKVATAKDPASGRRCLVSTPRSLKETCREIAASCARRSSTIRTMSAAIRSSCKTGRFSAEIA